MKRQIFACLVAAITTCCFSARAQYNKTYEVNIAGTSAYSGVSDIVETGNGSTCIVSGVSDGTSNQILLRKVDYQGNTIFETIHDLGSSFGPITKLHHTINDEYIAVGFYVMPATHPNPNYNYASQPFAIKFDNSGNHVWTKVFRVSLTYWPGINSNYEKVNITDVPDEVDGVTYILTYPADQDAYPVPSPPGLPTSADVSIGALKMDDNGNVYWNYKYFIPQATRPAGLYRNMDYPIALAYGNGKYFIAGPALKDAATYHQDINFYMSIDNMGNIVDDYRTFDAPGYNCHHDAIFDPAKNEFVMTYVFGAYYYPASYSASEIAITKIDAGGFNIKSTAYYYDADAIENGGHSIKENPAHDAYVIACNTSGSASNLLMNTGTASLLKVDKNDAPILYKSYNVHRTQGVSSVATYINPATGDENYAMGTYTLLSPGGYHSRIIATDNNLSVCGEYDRPVTWGYENIVEDAPIHYAFSFQNTTIPFNPPAVAFITKVTDCDLSGMNPNRYQSANAVNDIGKSLHSPEVYPTLLQRGENILNIEVTADNSTRLNVIATSVDGRVVFSDNIQVSQGANKIVVETPQLLPGNYVLKISSADNTIQKTERISRL